MSTHGPTKWAFLSIPTATMANAVSADAPSRPTSSAPRHPAFEARQTEPGRQRNPCKSIASDMRVCRCTGARNAPFDRSRKPRWPTRYRLLHLAGHAAHPLGTQPLKQGKPSSDVREIHVSRSHPTCACVDAPAHEIANALFDRCSDRCRQPRWPKRYRLMHPAGPPAHPLGIQPLK